jgi:polysaccharide pyruvyl transferase WcaK-like protein
VEKSGISGKEPGSDPAFMMPVDQTEQTQDQSKYIAVNICGWFRSGEYWGKDENVLQQEISSFAKLVDRLIEDFDHDIVFVNTVVPADSDVSKRIVQEMLYANRATVVDQIQTPREMKNLISSSAMLVGMRLHSIIFAVMTHTPFVAVNYDDKVKSFVERIGMEDYLIELEDLQDRDKIMDRCNKCWQNRHTITNSLHESAEDLHRIMVNEMWTK